MRFEGCHKTLSPVTETWFGGGREPRNNGLQYVISLSRGTGLRHLCWQMWLRDEVAGQQSALELGPPSHLLPIWGAHCGQFLLCHPSYSRPSPFFLTTGSNHSLNVPSFKNLGKLPTWIKRSLLILFIAAFTLQMA